MYLLAQVDGFPWKEVVGGTGVAAWAYLCYLFVTDKVRTNSGAQKEIDRAYELLRQQTERADKCDERMVAATNLAERFASIAEQAKKKPRVD